MGQKGPAWPEVAFLSPEGRAGQTIWRACRHPRRKQTPSCQGGQKFDNKRLI